MQKPFQHFSSFRVLTTKAGCTTTRNNSVYPIEFSKWSKGTVWILILTLLMCLFITSCTPLVLYPLARAFGGPKESELKVIRENFSRMQQDLPSSRLAVFPSCLVNFETNEWKPESPELMIDVFQDEHGIEMSPRNEAELAEMIFDRMIWGEGEPGHEEYHIKPE